MPEAVIVDAVRTPIGRAFKGSLAQLRPDETAAHVVDQLLERNPDVDPASVQDLYCGCGMPQGLTAFNVARIMVLLSEKLTPETTGTTISRYCASSLDAIRHAGNAIKAGEGDVYIAAGVEWVSKFNEATEAVRADDRNPNLQGKQEGQPNAYIEMGHTAVNVAKKYEVSRSDMDKFAQRSQELAVGSQESGFFDREIVAVTDQDGNQVASDDGPRASSTLEKLSALPEAFGEGGVTAGNSCPLNDGAAAVLVMS
ncbi:MAG: acetyl-CoA C-acyltransferase, partial [Actinomycetota bacterium]|nr:acetyl-CoA C-acyltransferase [Actinomycetota bacterium]